MLARRGRLDLPFARKFVTEEGGEPVGGRLALFWEVWAQWGAEEWVVAVLKRGYQLPFHTRPPLSVMPPRSRACPGHSQTLQKEIAGLLSKRVVEEVHVGGPGFYSRLFLVPKQTGGWRPVLDLSPLNKFLSLTEFKMETPRSVCQAVQPGDWMCSIDLKDAYFQVPVAPESRPFLRFTFQARTFQFRCLCFGLATAPQVFTRVFAVVSKIAHSQGIRLLRYLDDWLILGASEGRTLQARDMVLGLCRDLGIVVNWTKSDLIPSQTIQYLGMILDSLQFRVFPSDERVRKFVHLARHFLSSPAPPLRVWESLIGVMASLEKLVPGSRLHMRPLQFQVQGLQRGFVPSELGIAVDPLSEASVRWWLRRIQQRVGCPLRDPLPDLVLYTDASLSGWGAVCQGKRMSGSWSPDECNLHINLLELRAVRLALRSMQDWCMGKVVAVLSDNSTALAYIRRQGGTHSLSLFQETFALFQWLEDFRVVLLPRFVPGHLNVVADSLSRRDQVVDAEWSLLDTVCSALWDLWGAPWIDLFASSLNNKLPVYCSPLMNDGAWAVDAMLQDWQGWEMYCFPPFRLLPEVLRKFSLSPNARMTLIAPWWPHQPWFAPLLWLLTDHPRRLPLWKGLLRQPVSRRFHPSVESLRLHAWRLSSVSWESKDFRRSLLAVSRDPLGPLPGLCTKVDGGSSPIGAVDGVLIQSRLLFR